ncbi:hypothetical protein GW17_00050427, partial [Ensete ventricosum]
TALAYRQPSCQGAAGVAAPDGGRAGRGRQPLAGALQSAPFAGVALQASVLAGSYHPCGLLPLRATLASLAGCYPCERHWPPLRASPSPSRPPPCKGPWPRPGHGWSGRGLVVAGRPSSSLPSL